MAKESIERQRKPYEPIVALDKAALPHIYTLGVAEAYRRALLQHEASFPKIQARKEFQVGLFGD